MKSNRIKFDLIKLKNDFVSIISSPFKWDIDRINFFLLFLALLTASFFLDESLRDYVKSIHNGFYDLIFAYAHWYGKPALTIFAFILFYTVGIVASKDNFRLIGLRIFESFVFSGIIVTVIKSIVGRWRPYTGHGNFSFVPFTTGPNEHLSFPSGDVAVAFAFSVIIAGIFNNKIWKIFWYLLAVITSVGRIYHDQHWLSDVVAAAAISVYIGISINKRTYANTSSEMME